jgi:hypothetical protein
LGIGFGLHADEIHALERRAQLRQVDVGIDETGQHGRAREIDHARR